jgi:hypothetical protein
MPKSKAENYKEAIMSAVEHETESEAIAEAAKAAQRIRVAERIVRPEDLSMQVEKALEGTPERFHLKFDDGSELFLATTGGILTATVSK